MNIGRRSLLFAMSALAARPAFALYDDAPHPLLVHAPGAWRGTLTYRDYSPPYQPVTLPVRLSVALTGPAELALYYAFDDGPGKTVHSYEQMLFDFAAKTLVWVSGKGADDRRTYPLNAAATDAAGGTLIGFESPKGDEHAALHSLEISPTQWKQTKFELGADGREFVRNSYDLRRG